MRRSWAARSDQRRNPQVNDYACTERHHLIAWRNVSHRPVSVSVLFPHGARSCGSTASVLRSEELAVLPTEPAARPPAAR